MASMDIQELLANHAGVDQKDVLFHPGRTKIDTLHIDGQRIPVYINAFWTAKQRQGNALHEVSYRACFKPQLPRFFIHALTHKHSTVYDPFSGRGTTLLEAAMAGRHIVANDINPLSQIICEGRLHPPDMAMLKQRLDTIPLYTHLKKELDLSMFYERHTCHEILSLRHYLQGRKKAREEDLLDKWIRVVATNRLTGHSKGFFSVYTLPPNQATSPERQRKINEKRHQQPEYRNTQQIILKKSAQLMKDLSPAVRKNLAHAAACQVFLCKDAAHTTEIEDESIDLTVTSPPFLDIVNYAQDNWLRCWFNHIDAQEIARRLRYTRTLVHWKQKMHQVFEELYRITRRGGWIAFEVGEVRHGRIKLEEPITQVGIAMGLRCHAVMINAQTFTKTANIWGVKNNDKGTNSNRIVLFQRDP